MQRIEPLPMLPVQGMGEGPAPKQPPAPQQYEQPAAPQQYEQQPAAPQQYEQPAAPQQYKQPPPASSSLPPLAPSTTARAPQPAPPDALVVPNGAARRGAGFGLLIAAGGTVGGYYVLGGVKGAGAGLLLAGALRNSLRAWRGWGGPDPVARAEAAKSATMAVFGAAVGGYLGYTAYRGDEAHD
jgi:hypothetical protein